MFISDIVVFLIEQKLYLIYFKHKVAACKIILWQLSVPMMITIYASIIPCIITILLLIEINNAISSYLLTYNLIYKTEIKNWESLMLIFCIAMPEKPTMSDNENSRFWIWTSLEALAFLQHWQKVFSLSLPSIFLTSISPVNRKGKYTKKCFADVGCNC